MEEKDYKVRIQIMEDSKVIMESKTSTKQMDALKEFHNVCCMDELLSAMLNEIKSNGKEKES